MRQKPFNKPISNNCKNCENKLTSTCQTREEIPHTYDDAMTDPTPTGCACGYGGEGAKKRFFRILGCFYFFLPLKRIVKLYPSQLNIKMILRRKMKCNISSDCWCVPFSP